LHTGAHEEAAGEPLPPQLVELALALLHGRQLLPQAATVLQVVSQPLEPSLSSSAKPGLHTG
jgi:hypothetical protein